jgi:spore maturation protein SpmB
MRIAEQAGLIQSLAALLNPLMRLLFPNVPPRHPAIGAMVLNMGANMMGLGNAASPLGLRAMRHLASLNPTPGTASNAMVMFLTLNTASLQLIPAGAIALLAAKGAKNPGEIIIPAFIASFTAVIVAVVITRLLEPWFPVGSERTGQNSSDTPTLPEEPEYKLPEPRPLTPLGMVALVVYAAACLWMLGVAIWPPTGGPNPVGDESNLLLRGLKALALGAIPVMVTVFPLIGMLRGVKVYDEFLLGAKESFETAQRIIPYIVAMLVAIAALRSSGALDAFTERVGWLIGWTGFPPELVPLALLRSLSGSASMGALTDITTAHGADSFLGRLGGVIYGSSETTFYVIALYFGSIGVRNVRHAIAAGLAADAIAVAAGYLACRALL